MRLITALALGIVTPGLATAGGAQYDWCVDNDQSETEFDCIDFTGCENSTPFASIQDALSAGSQRPDAGSHRICVRSTAPHIESFTIDNTLGALGTEIRVEFRMTDDTSYCPAAGSQAAITILGDGSDSTDVQLFTLWSDFAGCTADQRSMDLFAVSSARLELLDARLANLGGSVATTDQGANLAVIRSRLERFEGQVETGAGAAVIEDSEVSGFSSNGAPLLDGTDGALRLDDSALFGNVAAGGAPLVRLGNGSTISHSLIGANVVLDSGSLVAAALTGDGPLAVVVASEITRNRLLGPGSAAAGPLLDPVESLLPTDNYCLNFGSQGMDYVGRPPLLTTGAPSSAPLIAFEAGAGSVGARLTLARTFVVDNASAGVIAVDGGGASAQLALLHDSFDAHDGPLVRGGAPDFRLVAARNLHTQQPTYAFDLGLGSVELTLEAMPDATGWGDELAATGVVGPALSYDAPTFTPVAEVVGWSSCARVMATCPNVTSCDELEAGGARQACALDTARSWYPDADLAAQITVDWPWETDAFPRGTGAAAMAGATGWTCDTISSPHDIIHGGIPGDSDGYSTLTDCDGDDPSATPVLPENNGIDTADCDEIDDDCWRCDDDDTSSGDDDDAACAPDDPLCVEPGCHGCGYAFAPTTGVALLLLGAPWLSTRRRRGVI